MKKIQISLVVALFSILLSACAARKPAPPVGDGMPLLTDVAYVAGSKDPGHRLDVYSPPHDDLWPVVVVIHGGAWIKGNKEMPHYAALSAELARAGYVVFNINYRLYPPTTVKGQAEDCMAAVIWAKVHAREYGGDPERIAVVGGSAGGHLGALVAYASDDPWFTPTGGGAAGLDSNVDAAVLFFPPMDFDRTMRANGSVLGPLGGAIFTGKVGSGYREALKHLTPDNHIDGQAVPTIFITGDQDELKLYPQSVKSQKLLEAQGVTSILHTAPGQKHGFIQELDSLETTAAIKAMIEFLDGQLKRVKHCS